MEFKKGKTIRGFDVIEFEDRYGETCSLQKSSLATEDAIWLGISDPKLRIRANRVIEGATEWATYPVPDDVVITSRMHLTRDQVRELIPLLQNFVDTGDI